ncbi:MAG: YceH family protein [Rhodanobacteraceae bacterium]|nr:YceH family protein [Rhodanobacteraceae bacterium]
MTDSAPTAPTIPQLSDIEARVLGCLVEKALTTPDQYPLTANAAMVAANQKTAREPVMELELGAVGHALRTLEDKKLVRVQHSPRALRYEHRFEEIYTLTPPQRAILCLLLLRGPQTPSELMTRAERLAKFSDIEQVKDTLDRLTRRQPALATRLPLQPGQSVERYMHLLCGSEHAERAAAEMRRGDDSEGHSGGSALGDRVSALEAQVARLTAALRDLGAEV